MVTGVDVIYGITTNMDRSVALYQDVLGLIPTNLSPFWSEFTAGGIRIALHPPMAEESRAVGGWTLCLACEDLKALRARVEAAGHSGSGEYHETPGGVIWNFLDPDGNSVDLIQPGATMELF